LPATCLHAAPPPWTPWLRCVGNSLWGRFAIAPEGHRQVARHLPIPVPNSPRISNRRQIRIIARRPIDRIPVWPSEIPLEIASAPKSRLPQRSSLCKPLQFHAKLLKGEPPCRYTKILAHQCRESTGVKRSRKVIWPQDPPLGTSELTSDVPTSLLSVAQNFPKPRPRFQA
jgi:hypothetical protein